MVFSFVILLRVFDTSSFAPGFAPKTRFLAGRFGVVSAVGDVHGRKPISIGLKYRILDTW